MSRKRQYPAGGGRKQVLCLDGSRNQRLGLGFHGNASGDPVSSSLNLGLAGYGSDHDSPNEDESKPVGILKKAPKFKSAGIMKQNSPTPSSGTSPSNSPVPGLSASESTDQELPSVSSSSQNGTTGVNGNQGIKPDSSQQSEVKDELDDKLADFMAEINAMSTDLPSSSEDVTQSEENTASPPPTKTEATAPADSVSSTETDHSKKVEDKPLNVENPDKDWMDKPVGPTCVWQHCMDQNTQYYYYWHTQTNEVQWDIPAEYSQYLLLKNEYEVKLEKYEEWCKKRREKGLPTEKSNSEEVVADSKGLQTPSQPKLVPYETTPQSSLKKGSSSSTSSNVTKSNESSNTSISQSSDVTSNHENIPNSVGEQQSECIGSSSAASSLQQSSVDTVSFIGPQLPSSSKNPSTTNSQLPSTSGTRVSAITASGALSNLGLDYSDGDSDEEEILSNSIEEKSKQSESIINGNETNTTSPSQLDVEGMLEEALVAAPKKRSCPDTSDSDSDDANLKMYDVSSTGDVHSPDKSEMPNQSKSLDSTSSKKVASDDDEDVLLDLDDIDRQLDLAMEQKQTKDKNNDSGEEHVEKDRKRKRPRSLSKESDHSSSEKNKRHSSNSRDRDKKRRHKHRKENKHKDDRRRRDRHSHKSRSLDSAKKEQIESMQSMINDKLEFLDINCANMPMLQVLFIQFQTRLSDWQAGGLSSSFFFLQLEAVIKQLSEYEESMAPTGWHCQWDRSYKRYFYINNDSGATQWDYPEEEATLLSKDNKSTPSKGSDSSGTAGPPKPSSSSTAPLKRDLQPPPPPPDSSCQSSTISHVNRSQNNSTELLNQFPTDIVQSILAPPPPPVFDNEVTNSLTLPPPPPPAVTTNNSKPCTSPPYHGHHQSAKDSQTPASNAATAQKPGVIAASPVLFKQKQGTPDRQTSSDQGSCSTSGTLSNVTSTTSNSHSYTSGAENESEVSTHDCDTTASSSDPSSNSNLAKATNSHQTSSTNSTVSSSTPPTTKEKKRKVKVKGSKVNKMPSMVKKWEKIHERD